MILEALKGLWENLFNKLKRDIKSHKSRYVRSVAVQTDSKVGDKRLTDGRNNEPQDIVNAPSVLGDYTGHKRTI